MRILAPDQSNTFSKIFELKILADDLANEFGYSLNRKRFRFTSISAGIRAFRRPQRPH